jgi:hypothetical protein
MIRVTWCEHDHTVACWHFKGRWNWRQFDHAVAQTRLMAAQQPNRLDVIYDIREMGLPPADFAAQLLSRVHLPLDFRGAGINVLVGGDHYVRLLLNTLEGRLPQAWRIYYADTLEEAHRVIQDDRQYTEKQLARAMQEHKPAHH